MRTVKYFKESSFGPITLYTGKRGSGLTLGAIIRIVQASRSKKAPRIVANCTLRGLSYEYITPEVFPSKAQSYLEERHLLLLDSGYNYYSSRTILSRPATNFFNLLRKSNSKAIFTTSMGLEVIDRSIRDLVTDIVLVSRKDPRSQTLELIHLRQGTKTVWATNEESGKKERYTKIYWKPLSKCIVRETERYWKYYNTKMQLGTKLTWE